MLVSAQSEDNQTELRTQRAHWSLQSVLELGWPQGFTATSQLGVGWKEDAKRNFVKKYMWRSYHQPIRIMNCNLSFTFLIGRNEDNHTADAARESGMVLSTWDFLLTTVFGRYHYPYCTGEETEVYRGWENCPSSYSQFISELGFKPKQKCALRPHSIYSPGLYSQVYKRQVWAIERTEKSISLGKEKFKNPCCLSLNSTQSGRRISSEGQQVIHSPSMPSEANRRDGVVNKPLQ